MNKVYTWEKNKTIFHWDYLYIDIQKKYTSDQFLTCFIKSRKQTIWFDFMLLFKMGEEEFQTSQLAL